MGNKENRKSFFVNDDGTLNIPIVTIVVVCITSVIFFGGFRNKIFNASTVGSDGSRSKNTTTTKVTGAASFETCNNCSLRFLQANYEMEANKELDLKDILYTENLSPYKVKFKDYDSSLVEIDNLVLKTKNKLGTTKVTAYYDNIVTELNLIITQNYISDAEFNDSIQYIYVNETKDLDVTLYPTGIEKKYLGFRSSDDSIVSFDSFNSAVGNKLGKATVNFNIGEDADSKSATVYVVKNRIYTYYKDDQGTFIGSTGYKYTSNLNMTLVLGIRFEDKENAGYTISEDQTDVSIDYTEQGAIYINKNSSIDGAVTFNGDFVKTADGIIYKIQIPLKYDSSKKQNNVDDIIKIYFTLTDGSMAEFDIYR